MQSLPDLYDDRSLEDVSFPTGSGETHAFLYKLLYALEQPYSYDYLIYGLPFKG